MSARPRSARLAAGALGSLALAAGSLAVIPAAPGYDAWAWLIWGREVTAGDLSTREGPAFKPLTVAAAALLAPLGAAAPDVWVVVARAAAVAAVLLAFRLGCRLAGGSLLAGVLAAAALALAGSYPEYAASGLSEGLLLALALAGAEAWRGARPRTALACALGCALLRVETWPFVLAAVVVLGRRRPRDHVLLALGAVLVPALWLGPEWLGSGDPLRSGARARLPEPGQPALADLPALASVREALALPLWPLWLGLALLAVRGWRGDARARGALWPAAAGAAWIALVAAMAQAGFSGESRYALPGAALVAVSGAVGIAAALSAAAAAAGTLLARARAPARPPGPGLLAPASRLAGGGLVLGLLVFAVQPELAGLREVRAAQGHQRALATDLGTAVRAAGGREAVLACGPPYAGRYRGPILAYGLQVPRDRIRFGPRAPGMVFVSRLTPRSAPEPAAPPEFGRTARAGAWSVLRACAVRVP